jgi:tetratricopeptide (TPR) repeat protein
MAKNFLFLFLVLLSTQSFAKIGDNSHFRIISQNELDERIAMRKDVLMWRYIVVPSIDRYYKDISETKDEEAILAKFSFMLKNNYFTRIEKYMNNCDDSTDISHLIKGLYYFSKMQYNQAIIHLEKFENKAYRFLKLLLIADCQYELLQDKKNYKSVIGAYQLALDCTDKEHYKTIINNRIRFIKYQLK